MFRVEVESLKDYFDFDSQRRMDLVRLDQLIKESAPGLKRYFHKGTPEGEPGMRFKMIGYGRSHFLAKNGKRVEWPAVGVALQRNYISVYLSITKDGGPLIRNYAGKLGEFRMGNNHFSFRRYEELDVRMVSALLAEADHLFNSDSGGSVDTYRGVRK